MPSPSLSIRNFGPLSECNLEFGDLTVLVGPQASGKSIALQLLKLIVDTGQVQEELRRYGFDWHGRQTEFLELYFGEGMSSLWRKDQTAISWNGAPTAIAAQVLRQQRNKKESLFFIPAQRVLAVRDGWPRLFRDFSPGDPFVVREFSERLRDVVEHELGQNLSLFPQAKRLKEPMRALLSAQLFGDFTLKVETSRVQKRLVLAKDGHDGSLPYMVWSAGQREFAPLLLGLYWLMPRVKAPRRGDFQWLVIEEPEMGLHPRAVAATMMLVFELLRRGYRVCLSTHSTHVLETLWAVKNIRSGAAKATPQQARELLNVLSVEPGQSMQQVAEAALNAHIKVFYFDRIAGASHDISDLDPGSADADMQGWGGLAEISARANEAVASVAAHLGKGSAE